LQDIDSILKIKKGRYFSIDFGFDKKKTALLVIDLQNDFLHDDGIYAKYGIDVKRLRAKLKDALKLSNLCKDLGIFVIHIKHVLHTNKKGKAVDIGLFASYARPWLVHEGLRAGTWGSEMLNELGKPDFEVEKNRLSGFHGTCLEVLLRGLNIETLIFSGFSTNLCVESTFRDALIRDFQVIGIKEAMITHDSYLQEASEKNMEIMGHCLSLEKFEEIAYRV
jgi:ureidoacrylate peracid hydrolase